VTKILWRRDDKYGWSVERRREDRVRPGEEERRAPLAKQLTEAGETIHLERNEAVPSAR
jgi:hypothetical protein